MPSNRKHLICYYTRASAILAETGMPTLSNLDGLGKYRDFY